MAVALMQMSLDFSQRVFTTTSGSEAIAACRKFAFEDGLDDHLQRALYDSICHRRHGCFIILVFQLDLGMLIVNVLIGSAVSS